MADIVFQLPAPVIKAKAGSSFTIQQVMDRIAYLENNPGARTDYDELGFLRGLLERISEDRPS